MTAEFVVVHDTIGRRAVCAVGAVCGDRAIIGIGTADDSEDDDRDRQDAHAKAKRAGLRALRRFASKAAPIVTSAVPGGALAREASKALLETRRAASDVQTAREHAQQVTGLLSPLAMRVIGDAPPATPSASVRALVRSLYAMHEQVQRAQRSALARIRAGAPNTRATWAAMDRSIAELGRIERRINAAGWDVEVSPESDFPYGMTTFVLVSKVDGTEWRP